MAAGERLANDELLLRRFDPGDDRHWSSDDAGKPARLRSPAVQFDESTDGSRMECSVYQDSKLSSLGLRRMDCLESGRLLWDIATATSGEVRRILRPSVPAQPNPFDVLEDEYPDGLVGAHSRDGAHAIVMHATPLKGSDKWYREIALKFRRDSVHGT